MSQVFRQTLEALSLSLRDFVTRRQVSDSAVVSDEIPRRVAAKYAGEYAVGRTFGHDWYRRKGL